MSEDAASQTARDEAEALMDEGWALLDRNNPQAALKVGRQLERRRYSGGFEIQALALAALRRRNKAIAVLERGVETVPHVWLLWQLLGNYRSDAGDYDGACVAYSRAGGPDCDPISLAYNHANALTRAGRWDEAKARIEPLFEDSDALKGIDPQLGLFLVNLYEDILRHDGKDEEATALIERYSGLIARAATSG